MASMSAAAMALTCLTAAPASAAAAPAHTVSRYVPLTGAASDATAARDAGCAEGRTGRSGVRVLFFGTQESGGRLRHPGTTAGSTTPRVPVDNARAYAAQWAAGFAACRTGGATAQLAMGVNNKSDGGVAGATAGAEWARIVTQTARQVSSGPVTIVGAVDAEPSWSPRAWARDWVDAFTGATSRTLYAANSADSCPTYGSSATACANGWSLGDLHYVATGAARSIHAIPQIYRTDGIQARQWSAISSWGVRNGAGPVRFAGAMSQRMACDQRGGCTNTNNTPTAAWTQLYEELNAHSDTAVRELPYVTDMRWP
ncbi:hypothetical protein DEF23_25750 [Marinitenerispora sediminis]|uniref:Uncharacterized protein n=1 Tax=Marinitenerispora sediminis TaxID=1931232 RepID=A0A368SZG0_9ACTN|nr:hypothetical protein DEF28_24700 [Marinitenerispora sediminis]RCV48028.1 hypothetical protein DEF23_25750 [Marinitenerispora sediminis]RCV51025.1 hypothetical protein DEF24_23635 [Marinitenerispora sediminis]